MTEQQQKRYDTFLKDFEDIISIDSSSDLLEGIQKVAEFLKERLKKNGLEVTIEAKGEKGVPCLEARTPSKNGRYDFMFLGHMDTVFPPGEVAKRPFKIEGNRALGPGTNDMKGGLLVAINVIDLLKQQGKLDDVSICVAFNGDEETGSHNSREWIESVVEECDNVFVFEPCRPGFRHVMRRKGGGKVQVIAHGVASHAGADPEKGANAVVELAHQITKINELNSPDSGISAQCTVISGGDKTNIIPDRAELKVDLRVSTMADMEAADAFFKALPETTHIKGTSIEVYGGSERPPLEPNDGTWKLWETLHASAKDLGIESDYLSTGGCSDGNWTAAKGVPTIDGMGPVGENSHREDEYSELDSFIPMVEMIAATCLKIASEK